MPQLVLEDFNLEAAERRLCLAALEQGGNIVNAAKLLGITRHALKRRIIKLRITWPQPTSQIQGASPSISPNS
jgi:DNA-binding NtrC family response regulator